MALWMRRLWVTALLLCLSAVPGFSRGRVHRGPWKASKEGRMSGMGHLAARARAALAAGGIHPAGARFGADGGGCLNEPDCEDEGGDEEGPAGGQAEVSIAVDSTHQHIVIGFNDTRGFALNPTSVSGFMYSDDGGATFVDGGQLPSPGIDMVGATKLPQVFGDPEVKYLGACNFVYASILVSKFSATRTVQTMGIHRSSDCGHTWEGPFEVTSATNPNGLVTGSGTPRDAADKEFMDVDPDTGRLLMSWSNFTPVAAGGVEISTTYSDNVLSATPPTWSARAIVAATDVDGQSSVPRFAGHGSPRAYVAWRRFPSGLTNTTGFAYSTDNGATWSAPVDTSPEFFTMDQVLGNDRVNTSPSLAVDTSGGARDGSVYLVYANNDFGDGADVAFQRSTDGGLTFSAPTKINSRVGLDRAQWFPWVTVDGRYGRVYVFYYDQGIAGNGDLSETSYTFSDNGGNSWKPPVPITTRPFHAGWGNDTGQPNLGDYSQAVAFDHKLYTASALASRPPGGFTDGQPSTSMTVPDVFFKIVREGARDDVATVPVRLGAISFTDSGGSTNGFIDPGETIKLTIPLTNYVTNPLDGPHTLGGVRGQLSTTTPGVKVDKNFSTYPNLAPGATANNNLLYVLKIDPSFVQGTPIDLRLSVHTSNQKEEAGLLQTLFTGTPDPTTIFAENFDSVAPGTLPAGWATVHVAAAGPFNTVPWTTSNAAFGDPTTNPCGGSNAAFHINANDGPAGGLPTRFERLFSPVIFVPADAEYVNLDMDVCYDTEDDPNFNVLAYDGFLLRIFDATVGNRSVLVEAFEDELTTGSAQHFPKHFPRASSALPYFQDMSAWAGASGGSKHVHMRLPGMQGSFVQLRFEFTQDGSAICSDVRPGHTCGVSVDNIVMQSVKSLPPK